MPAILRMQSLFYGDIVIDIRHMEWVSLRVHPLNQAVPPAKTPITPPMPTMLAMEPNDSATQPNALMPSMEVAVAIAV